jgi:hypothetical protein
LLISPSESSPGATDLPKRQGRNGIIEAAYPWPIYVAIALVPHRPDEVEVPTNNHRVWCRLHGRNQFAQELVRPAMVRRTVDKKEAPKGLRAPMKNRGAKEEIPFLSLAHLKSILPKT